MKKNLAVILTLLALALVFTGCATTSDTAEASSAEAAAPSWNDASSKAATPDAPAPYTSKAPQSSVTPKQAQKAGLDALFDGVSKWPENAWSLPLAMKPAEDSAVWDGFVELVTNNGTIGEMEEYLLNWYGKYGWTPEFYAACHNYYYAKASDILSNATSEADIEVVYSCFDRCFDVTYRGFMQYPDRLDLWCGYIRAALTLGDFDTALNCYLAIFDRLDFNVNNWYWRYNDPFYIDESDSVREDEFVSIMHDYICEWLNYDDGLEYAGVASQKLVDYFPENPIALNDLSICCRWNEDLEGARTYLERAHKADPTDYLVTANLAYVCEDLGDYDASLKYANELIQSGDEDYVDRGIRLCAELMQLINPGR